MLVILAHSQEPFIHAMSYEPDCSSTLIRHNSGALHLELLSSVMKVYSDQGWRATNNKIEFNQFSLFNS